MFSSHSLPPRAKGLDVSKKWHRAFHGTRPKFLDKILEVGELAKPGNDEMFQFHTRFENLGFLCLVFFVLSGTKVLDS